MAKSQRIPNNTCIISPEHVEEEMSRLALMPKMERVMFLLHRPLAIVCDDVVWFYVEPADTPENFRGRFITIPPYVDDDLACLCEVMLVNDTWEWRVVPEGKYLAATGTSSDVSEAMSSAQHFASCPHMQSIWHNTTFIFT